jgi:hypothetical protein
MFALSVRYVRGIKFSFIRRDLEYVFTPLFNVLSPSLKVIDACEHHGIKNVIELKDDWNDEMILQFYYTLYLDEKSSKLFL